MLRRVGGLASLGILACGGGAEQPTQDWSKAIAVVERGQASVSAPEATRDHPYSQWDGVWDYGEDRRIFGVWTSAVKVKAGGTITLGFQTKGLQAAHARVAFVPVRAASRQLLKKQETGADITSRGLWKNIELVSGDNQVVFEIPEGWQATRTVLMIEIGGTDGGESEILEVRHGARAERTSPGQQPGASALLALLEVECFPRRAHAVAVPSGSIVLDGVLDEPIWQRKGTALTMAYDGEPQEGLGTDRETLVWFAYDAEALYVAARIPDVDIYSSFRAHDDPLWTEEAFEIFIHGTANRVHYLEYQLSAHGVTFDAYFARYREGDESFDSSWETAVQVQGSLDRRRQKDREWSAEIRIEWAEICEKSDARCGEHNKMVRGDELRLNLVRVERVSRKRSVALSLSPLRSHDFHAWQNAAILELE